MTRVLGIDVVVFCDEGVKHNCSVMRGLNLNLYYKAGRLAMLS